MDTKATIIVTGAAGFIGSCMVEYLNQNGYENLIIVDDFGVEEKRANWEAKKFIHAVERQSLFEWLEINEPQISSFIHLGARTDTTEFNYSIHEELNVEYSKNVWHYCVENKVPLIYASSAATYGSGEFGYDDNHELPYKLQPLNPYGVSKNEFDKWALASPQPSPKGEGEKQFQLSPKGEGEKQFQLSPKGEEDKQLQPSPKREGLNAPPFWAGLKFFNVYGPNEYHKARMASVIWHSFNQIKKDGVVKLFKSHRPDFEDGQQLRDFIYVKDLVSVIFWMMETVDSRQSTVDCGLYNLGTGTARSFDDLVKATFAGLDLQPNIKYIDMPLDIRDKYQYFTEANMQKLKDAGYTKEFYSLEDGVEDYVRNYLNKGLKKY